MSFPMIPEPGQGVDHFPCGDVATDLAMNPTSINARFLADHLQQQLFQRITRFGLAFIKDDPGR